MQQNLVGGAPKRSRDDLTDNQTTETREKKAKTDEEAGLAREEKYEVRILIDSRQVGSVIGKGGSNVTRMRQECDVFMSILKAQEGVRERILTVKGFPANIARAIREIGDILIRAQEARVQKAQELPKPEDSMFTIRFLVHQTLVGGVIGKGGVLVQQTQQQTNARVQVSQEPLGRSSEKSVTVSGTLDHVYAACQIVVLQLSANPLRAGVQSILYEPLLGPGPEPYAAQGPGYYPPAPAGAGYPPQHSAQPYYPPHVNSHGAPHYPPQQAGYGYAGAPPPHSYGQQGSAAYPPPYGGAPGAGFPPQAGGAPLSKQKIVIPSVCAGNVIGRSGSIISSIRQQSGTFISIADADPATPRERMVTISGSPQGIQAAVQLIQRVVEQYEGPPAPRDGAVY